LLATMGGGIGINLTASSHTRRWMDLTRRGVTKLRTREGVLPPPAIRIKPSLPASLPNTWLVRGVETGGLGFGRWVQRTKEVMDLIAAARSGQLKVVRRLVTLGADVNVQNDRGQRPLHWSVVNGHVDVMWTLVEMGADVEAKAADGRTPLHYAAHYGRLEVVNTVVALEADVHAQSATGWSALHWAARSGHVEVVRALLQRGADVHAKSCLGNTPLHLASNTETVACLLEAGGPAALNRRNTMGDSPLFQAIHRGNAPAVTALVRAGARAEKSDSAWWTQLIVDAVTQWMRYGHAAAVTELVAASAELTRRLNENGHFARTAVQLAELSTHYRCEELQSALAAAQP
jgi:ankyrin repeat protein